MRIFIAGMDGYLGWSLAQHLTARRHDVGGVDNGARRGWVAEMGSDSAVPITSMEDRLAAAQEHYGRGMRYWEGDLCDYDFVDGIITEFAPDAIVHVGECPSAPYSMIDAQHTVYVQTNNIVSTFNLMFALRKANPEGHLLKLGTMGEYGTPNVPIPEGFFDVEYRGRKDRLPFPRQAGSWYHWSKVHGSNNIMFACKIWGMRATDIMQGVVFGTRFNGMGDDPRLATRLDFDQCFGTAINRFSCQAVIGHPLTLFGKGHQKRGFLPLRDSMQCLTLALENPPEAGEYRVFNQFEEVYDLTQLAEKVRRVGGKLGLDVEIRNLQNPRMELEEHYYEPDHEKLRSLGYRPAHSVEDELEVMIPDLIKHRDRIQAHESALIPDVRWDGSRERVSWLEEPQATSAGD